MSTCIVRLGATLIFIVAAIAVHADDLQLAKVNEEYAASENSPVDTVCLTCICEAVSGCNAKLTCDGDVCGLFRITRAYWSDSGRPTLNGEPRASVSAFSNCANDPACAAQTVQRYMAIFGQDCNGDGIINCFDYAAIHLFGGYGCRRDISPYIKKPLEKCLSHYNV